MDPKKVYPIRFNAALSGDKPGIDVTMQLHDQIHDDIGDWMQHNKVVSLHAIWCDPDFAGDGKRRVSEPASEHSIIILRAIGANQFELALDMDAMDSLELIMGTYRAAEIDAIWLRHHVEEPQN